jgi:ribosomal protein S18 acetylase RimI-like enzyme
MQPSVDLDIRPVSPDQHDAVLRYFDLVAYADNPAWSSCYCMERLAPDFAERTKDQNRASRSELMRSARANGLVAYRLGRVVGWCHAAPKTELLNLPTGSESDIGAIVCFVVAPDARRQGIATALLAKACEHLRERGMRAVEAYPRTVESADAVPQVFYVGPKAMYLRSGFQVIREIADSTLVRKAL